MPPPHAQPLDVIDVRPWRAPRSECHHRRIAAGHRVAAHPFFRKPPTSIESFDDLLRAAIVQSEPQRLLFFFVTAGVDADATADQKARFEAGQGGTLTPLMCVDKLPDELASFDTLVDESKRFEHAWDMVLVAALPGSGGSSPTSQQVEAPLQRMVDSIKSGRIGGFILFDAQGRPVQFS